MMTWNGFSFCFPSGNSMISITTLHDFLCVVLFCVIFFVFLNFYFSYFLNNFSLFMLENHLVEFVWTIVPFFILTFVIFSSVKSLYFSDSCFFCGLSMVVMGHQWYWSYFFKDFDNFYFDSYLISNFLRVLDVDNRIILPFNTPLRVLASSCDVIHSWTIPSLGVKMDCIPGRINQSCLSFSRCGIFFGQCSEICGINHSYMPISVEVLSLEDFFSSF